MKIRWLHNCLAENVFPLKVVERLRTPSEAIARRIMEGDISRLMIEKERVECDILINSTIIHHLQPYAFLLYVKYCTYILYKTRRDMYHKLSHIISDSPLYKPLPATCYENAITNLSSYKLSQTETFALSFGLKFCIPPTKLKEVVIRSQFESLYNQLSDLASASPIADGLLKARFVGLCNEMSKYIPSRCATPLTIAHINALRSLSRNKDIVITRPDKGGGGIVILDRSTYLEKMQVILSDNTKFRLDTK